MANKPLHKCTNKNTTFTDDSNNTEQIRDRFNSTASSAHYCKYREPVPTCSCCSCHVPAVPIASHNWTSLSRLFSHSMEPISHPAPLSLYGLFTCEGLHHAYFIAYEDWTDWFGGLADTLETKCYPNATTEHTRTRTGAKPTELNDSTRSVTTHRHYDERVYEFQNDSKHVH